MNLKAPMSYWELSVTEKKDICNGAGPKGYGWIVPDRIFGLSITSAANIHDYMYHIGKTKFDKKEADNYFLNNMLEIIESKTTKFFILGKILLWLRSGLAMKYYRTVKDFGDDCFFNGNKNLIKEY